MAQTDLLSLLKMTNAQGANALGIHGLAKKSTTAGVFNQILTGHTHGTQVPIIHGNSLPGGSKLPVRDMDNLRHSEPLQTLLGVMSLEQQIQIDGLSFITELLPAVDMPKQLPAPINLDVDKKIIFSDQQLQQFAVELGIESPIASLVLESTLKPNLASGLANPQGLAPMVVSPEISSSMDLKPGQVQAETKAMPADLSNNSTNMLPSRLIEFTKQKLTSSQSNHLGELTVPLQVDLISQAKIQIPVTQQLLVQPPTQLLKDSLDQLQPLNQVEQPIQAPQKPLVQLTQQAQKDALVVPQMTSSNLRQQEAQAEQNTQTPVKTLVSTPFQTSVQTPVQTPVQMPVQMPVQVPVQVPVQTLVDAAFETGVRSHNGPQIQAQANPQVRNEEFIQAHIQTSQQPRPQALTNATTTSLQANLLNALPLSDTDVIKVRNQSSSAAIKTMVGATITPTSVTMPITSAPLPQTPTQTLLQQHQLRNDSHVPDQKTVLANSINKVLAQTKMNESVTLSTARVPNSTESFSTIGLAPALVQKLDLLLTRTGVLSNNVPTTSKNTDRGSYTDANLKTISSIANVAPTTTSDTPSMDLGQRFASLMLGDSAAQIAARQMQNQLGQQLQRMVKEGRWQANLSLNPARLGHVNINLLMEDGVLQTQILSTNAGVRELLEASLPRLKDQLEQSGMQLSSVSVGSHNTGQNKRHSDQPDWNLTQVGSEANDNASVAGTTNRAKHDGDIDTFA